MKQDAVGALGGEPVSDDPPAGSAKLPVRGRGGAKYGDASKLAGGTGVEEIESSSGGEAERVLEAAWERYRQSKFDEQASLKDYLLERYDKKED